MPFSSISLLIGFGLLYYYCSYGPSTVLQVLTSVISTGPDNYPLNASYKTADGYAFQVSSAFCHIDFDCLRVVSSFIVIGCTYIVLKDALGKSIEEICNVVPGGSLVFFPSYKLMEKLCNRWRETGQWSRLNAKKPLFVGQHIFYAI